MAHNADKPFRILTGTYQITVLGTRFNVMAYPESKRFEIDLVEGSVQVNNANDPTDQLILCPHEQAILRNNRLWRQASEFDNEEYLKMVLLVSRAVRLGKFWIMSLCGKE